MAEVQRITAGTIFSWIFGVLFLIMGIRTFGASFMGGLIIILCALLIIPYSNNFIGEKLKFEISGGVKFLLAIVILVTGVVSTMHALPTQTPPVDEAQLAPSTGADSSINEQAVPQAPSQPAINQKTQYVKEHVSLEEVEVAEGYGQYDVPGYSPKKPIVQGKVRNTGDRTLSSVTITVYFLDQSGTRIGERDFTPVNTYSFGGDQTPLKPNYVRDWGYVVADAPSGWAKKIEVVVSDIEFES